MCLNLQVTMCHIRRFLGSEKQIKRTLWQHLVQPFFFQDCCSFSALPSISHLSNLASPCSTSSHSRFSHVLGSISRPGSSLSSNLVRNFDANPATLQKSILTHGEKKVESNPNPTVLNCGEESNVCTDLHDKETIQFLKSLDFDLDKLKSVSISGQVGLSGLKDLVAALERAGIWGRRAGILLESHPKLFQCSVSDIEGKIFTLEQLGLQKKEIQKLLCGYPALLSLNKVEELQSLENLGVEKQVIKHWFMRNPQALSRVTQRKIRQQLDLWSRLGLSMADIGKILGNGKWLLRIGSGDTFRPEVKLLKCLGIKDEDIGKFYIKHPMFLGYSAKQHLKPAIKVLEGLGLRGEAIGRVLIGTPYYVKTLCASKTKEKIAFLERHCVDRESIGKLVRRNPGILKYSLERKLKPGIGFLEFTGLKDKEVFHALLSLPRLLGSATLEWPTDKVRALINFGFTPGSVMLVKAVILTSGLCADEVDARFHNLLSFGFSNEAVRKMVTHLPDIFRQRQEDILQKVDYLLHTSDYSLSEILKLPMFLCFHFEHRIKPRLRMLEWLKVERLSEKRPTLARLMSSSEGEFLKQFVDPYPEGPAVFQRFLKEARAMQS